MSSVSNSNNANKTSWDDSPFAELPPEMIRNIVKKLDFLALLQLEEAGGNVWAEHILVEWKSIAKQIGCPIYYGDPKTKVKEHIKDLLEKINYIPEEKPADILEILSKETVTVQDIKLLQDCLNARNTLVVWTRLAEATGLPPPNHNFTTSQAVLDEANRFSGWVTEHQERLLQLTSLDLSGFHLTSLPPEIGKLTGLQRIFLQINGLTSLPAEFAQLQQLQDVDLSENKFIRSPDELEQLPNLREIQLHGNPIPQLQLEEGMRDIGDVFAIVDQLPTYAGLTASFVGLLYLGLQML